MATTSRGKRGRIVIAKSLKLLENHKRLFALAAFGYVCKFLIYVAIITPFLHSREQLMQVNNLSAGQIVLVVIVFMLMLFVINVMLFFFNTAIIVNLIHFLRYHKEASIKFGLSQAFKQYMNVFLWALFAGTAGLVFNLLPQSSQYKLKLQTLLRNNHWHIASFLVLPIIMDKKLLPVAALRESGRLINTLWGNNLRANYSVAGLLFWLRVPILLIFIGSVIFAQSHITIIVVGLIAGFLLLLVASFYQMIHTTVRVVSYCYAEYGITVAPFSQELIERLFVQKIPLVF